MCKIIGNWLINWLIVAASMQMKAGCSPLWDSYHYLKLYTTCLTALVLKAWSTDFLCASEWPLTKRHSVFSSWAAVCVAGLSKTTRGRWEKRKTDWAWLPVNPLHKLFFLKWLNASWENQIPGILRVFLAGMHAGPEGLKQVHRSVILINCHFYLTHGGSDALK